MSYTEAEAKAGINISLGSSAASPTATPPVLPITTNTQTSPAHGASPHFRTGTN